jgi:hypothetical protein
MVQFGLRTLMSAARGSAGRLARAPPIRRFNMGGFNMPREKVGWLSQFERKVAYDRDTFMTICQRYLGGEQLSEICAKPPMPVAQCFMSWVQYNEEARDIWDCALKFNSDRVLAKKLNTPIATCVRDWSDAVYDKLEHGYSLNNYLRQAYTMPDWKKLYPLVGDPPVWTSENLQDYEDLLKEITQLLKPRDLIELIYTKEMADAIWEEKRESREKNGVPERQYQVRLSEAHAVRVAEARRRNLPMPKQAAQEPGTALDHIRGFRTGFKTYQALDRAQCRKKKRRDNAPRQIARWRDSFGGKAEVLPDKFVAELALAKRDGVAPFLSDTQTDDILDESMQADPSPVPAGKLVQADPSPVPGGEAVNGPRPLAHTEEVAQAATSVALPDAIAQSAFAADPANAAQSVPAAGAFPNEAADAAPPRTLAGEVEVEVHGLTERIDFVAWLSGAKRYPWNWMAKAGEKAFQRSFSSKKALVRHLVLDCKIVRPDQVRLVLEPWLLGPEFPSQSGAGTNTASLIGASGETPGAASPLAAEAGSAEVVPTQDPAGAQAAPSLPGAGAFQKKPADAAPPRTSAHEVEIDVDGVSARIKWIDWLTGAQRYPSHWLIKAGEKAFNRHFSSKCALLRKLVLECKMIPPDQLCSELALLVSKLEPRRMPRPARWEARP